MNNRTGRIHAGYRQVVDIDERRPARRARRQRNEQIPIAVRGPPAANRLPRTQGRSHPAHRSHLERERRIRRLHHLIARDRVRSVGNAAWNGLADRSRSPQQQAPAPLVSLSLAYRD